VSEVLPKTRILAPKSHPNKTQKFFNFSLPFPPILYYDSTEQKLNRDDFGDLRRVQPELKSPLGIWRKRLTFALIPPPAEQDTRRQSKGAPRG
jgi:hypothetical protein